MRIDPDLGGEKTKPIKANLELVSSWLAGQGGGSNAKQVHQVSDVCAKQGGSGEAAYPVEQKISRG